MLIAIIAVSISRWNNKINEINEKKNFALGQNQSRKILIILPWDLLEEEEESCQEDW